jgi:hypothetical protein
MWPVSKSPDTGGELGWDLDDILAGLEEPLGQRASDVVCSFHRPHPYLVAGARVAVDRA